MQTINSPQISRWDPISSPLSSAFYQQSVLQAPEAQATVRDKHLWDATAFPRFSNLPLAHALLCLQQLHICVLLHPQPFVITQPVTNPL